MSRRVAVIGGGPGGLFFATLAKSAGIADDVTVFERNRADDTFGFGVVFSDATLAGIHDADPVLRSALREHGAHWDDIEVRLKGERHRCGGNGMAAIGRRTLLSLLQRRAAELGVELRFRTEVCPGDLGDYDLVVAADGARSQTRRRHLAAFGLTEQVASAKFIWFGTTYPFDGLTFVHERGPHGVFAVHGYPIGTTIPDSAGDKVSTFIVETDEASWRAAGLDAFDVTAPAGPSDLRSKRYLENLFAEQIDGHPLLVNNSRWSNFRTHRVLRWHTGNIVLLGDAAHTAHFSVGSGTKMAMEDAVALATALAAHPDDLATALDEYEATARPSVERIQDSARPSLSWWENFGRYHDAFEAWQFAFHFLTRSMNGARLAKRAPEFVAATRRAWRARSGSDPLRTPLAAGETLFPARSVEVRTAGAGAVVEHRRPVALLPAPEGGVRPRAWGLWLRAPETETGIGAVLPELSAGVRAEPVVVAVHGGTRLTRTLLSEQARLRHGLPTLFVDDELSRDDAETLVLSGRADLVGGSAAAVARWGGADAPKEH